MWTYPKLRRSFNFLQHFGLCTNIDSEAPTLKGELKRLFKLIHPDLFYGQHVEQATNQRSFQLLQEYLDAAKGKGNPQHFAYNFEFFIREDADPKKHKKVKVSLPPPQVRYHPQRGPEILPNTQLALGKLLSACGLSGHVSGGVTGGEVHISLSDLFQQASEIQRRNDATSQSSERDLTIVKNALRIGRGIKASFRSPLSNLSLVQQIEALKMLATALDRSPSIKLSGHSVLIGDCYGVDANGNVWLCHEGDVQTWSTFLQTVDLNKAVRYRQDAATRRILELKAARLMEIDMIFTHDALAVQPDYTTFLKKIIEEAMQQGAASDGRFAELPVCVVETDDWLETDNTGDRSSCLKVDRVHGYVYVPLWETLTNIYKFIEQQGEEALQIRQKIKNSEEHIESLKLIVRKKLRLRHLTFDKMLRPDECLAACMRLIHFAPELERYTEGLSICISDEHVLPLEGSKSFMRLKWNFNLVDL